MAKKQGDHPEELQRNTGRKQKIVCIISLVHENLPRQFYRFYQSIATQVPVIPALFSSVSVTFTTLRERQGTLMITRISHLLKETRRGGKRPLY